MHTSPLGRIDAQPTSSAFYEQQTIAWSFGCRCYAATVPCVILDPFLGSGTTAVAAESLGRDWLGIELSTDYAAQARDRIALAGVRDPGVSASAPPPATSTQLRMI